MTQFIILLTIILAGVAFSLIRKKLTPAAALTGSILAIVLYLGMGFTGVSMMAAFFIAGTVATSWKRHEKRFQGIAQENQNGRTAGQVFANAGVGGLAALVVYCYPQLQILRLIAAASFASATADTLSSELGNVYGKRFYNIISFKKDQRGLDGVISLEGSLLGVVGSCLIAVVYSIGFGWGIHTFIVIVIAGTIGNLTDSILGATLERRGILKNDAVNFLNTLVGGLVVLLLIDC